MRADLHVHSVRSDGDFFAEELADGAKKEGVELIAVTDHDNFGGYEENKKAFSAVGIECVCGVEISAYEGKTKLHITGYGFCGEGEKWKSYQNTLTLGAYERMYDVLYRLKKYKGFSLGEKEVLSQRKIEDIPVHTMHIVRALIARGYYPNPSAAFRDCFTPLLPTYSFVGRPTPEWAIDALHSLGGIACIAHPARIALDFKEEEGLIRRLIKEGADGMECYYSSHTESETEYFLKLARECDCFVTGGSDFHADGAGRTIGTPYFEPSESLLRTVRNSSK